MLSITLLMLLISYIFYLHWANQNNSKIIPETIKKNTEQEPPYGLNKKRKIDIEEKMSKEVSPKKEVLQEVLQEDVSLDIKKIEEMIAKEFPSITSPSTGIFSPGFTKSISPTMTSSSGISSSSPFLSTKAVLACSSMSFLIASEDRSG